MNHKKKKNKRKIAMKTYTRLKQVKYKNYSVFSQRREIKAENDKTVVISQGKSLLERQAAHT